MAARHALAGSALAGASFQCPDVSLVPPLLPQRILQRGLAVVVLGRVARLLAVFWIDTFDDVARRGSFRISEIQLFIL